MFIFKTKRVEYDTLRFKFYAEYQYALKVINSCQSLKHVDSCSRIIDNLSDKWQIQLKKYREWETLRSKSYFELWYLHLDLLSDLRDAVHVMQRRIFVGEIGN